MVDFGGRKKLSTGSAGRPAGAADRPSFAAIVGQEELKTALLAVGANDALDGLLVRGEKGTAKSTAVRGLVDCLPEQRAVADCPFGCAPDDPNLQCVDCRDRSDPPVERRQVPLVTLPLGATREQVVGTLSVADALEGSAEFDPGLLARAHRGILYVDEVNLLSDHLVDIVLDAAASGVNRVERDGVSRTHPADFTLVGTMNPEEGDLRPQLRDRFALQATVTGCSALDDRVAIIDTALDGDDHDSDDRGSSDSDDPARRLQRARDLLADVALPEEFRRDVAECCRDAGVDGHRADIATARTARTLAALEGRTRVIEGDLRRAAEFALPHRLQSQPFEDPPDPDEIIDDHFDDAEQDDAEQDDEQAGDDDSADQTQDEERADPDAGDEVDGTDTGDGEGPDASETGGDSEDEDGESPESGAAGEARDGDESGQSEPQPQPAGANGDNEERGEHNGSDDGSGGDDDHEDNQTEEGTPLLPGQQRAGVGDGAAPEIDPSDSVDATGTERRDGSRTQVHETTSGSGARVRSERATAGESIDATASVRAAATRGSDAVQSRDLRKSVRAETAGALVVFALDASASMRPAMRAAKGVAIDLLEDAYQQRDEVAVCTFAGEESEVVLPPTDSVTLAARHLKDLPTGDRTPLPAGLQTAAEVLDRADPAVGVVVLVTDGRANGGDSPVSDTRAAARDLARRDAHLVAVDAAPDDRSTLTGDVVDITDGERVPLDALSPDAVEQAVDRAASPHDD